MNEKTMKLVQALELDPSHEIHFKGPFDSVTTSHLKLTNPTDRHIGFKVKTTAPKTYCVRPNGGYIQPQQSVTVSVMLQPFNPGKEDRSRDKFMVQSVYVPEGESFSETIWQDVPPEALMNSKLKCVFDFPAEKTKVVVDVADHPKPISQQPTPVEKTPAAKEIKQTRQPDDEAEAKILQEENKRLYSELHNLRQENSALKEEGMRSRLAQGTRSKAATSESETEKRSRPPPLANQTTFFTPQTIAMFVAALIAGILIAKMNVI